MVPISIIKNDLLVSDILGQSLPLLGLLTLSTTVIWRVLVFVACNSWKCLVCISQHISLFLYFILVCFHCHVTFVLQDMYQSGVPYGMSLLRSGRGRGRWPLGSSMDNEVAAEVETRSRLGFPRLR